jgi:hypothetical protein
MASSLVARIGRVGFILLEAFPYEPGIQPQLCQWYWMEGRLKRPPLLTSG